MSCGNDAGVGCPTARSRSPPPPGPPPVNRLPRPGPGTGGSSPAPGPRLGALDGVAGGFGGVLPSAGHGPPDRPVGLVFGGPAGVLLEPVVVPALRVPVAQAGPPAGLVGH